MSWRLHAAWTFCNSRSNELKSCSLIWIFSGAGGAP